jgi:cysteine desulfurase
MSGIYLDYASATPVDPRVLAAMQPYFIEQFYNPSADYEPARSVASILLDARGRVARVLGTKTPEIIFTAGATEANNLAIHGVMRQFPEATVAISAVEHDSVRLPAGCYQSTSIPVDKNGRVDSDSVRQFITDKTVLISIMQANNEVGTVQPVRRIAAELAVIRRERQKNGNALPLYFHVDAAQSGNYLDMHVHRLGVDMLTINGGKIYGPKQSGALFVRSGVQLEPVIIGGGQERNLRSGTENVPGIIGLARALEIAVLIKDKETKRVTRLRDELQAGILKIDKKIVVNGHLKYRLPNNLHVTLPGHDNERVLMELDKNSVYAAAGSACSASTGEPSHVLAAMGVDAGAIRSSIRFSLGRNTKQADIVSTLNTLRSILA